MVISPFSVIKKRVTTKIYLIGKTLFERLVLKERKIELISRLRAGKMLAPYIVHSTNGILN